MAIELVLDASVSLAWFRKESPERAAYAGAVSAAAADGAVLHVPVQWGIELVLPLSQGYDVPIGKGGSRYAT
jgi:hypothetical protein